MHAGTNRVLSRTPAALFMLLVLCFVTLLGACDAGSIGSSIGSNGPAGGGSVE